MLVDDDAAPTMAAALWTVAVAEVVVSFASSALAEVTANPELEEKGPFRRVRRSMTLKTTHDQETLES